ncbi:MAG: aminodeoxychorismate synthase component I, partial [Myxococcota bacterium]
GVVRALLPRQGKAEVCSEFPFVGGAIGYLGYELAERTEPVSLHRPNDLGLADLVLLFVDRLLAFDHEEGTACVFGLGFGRDRDRAEARARAAAGEFAAVVESARKRRAGSKRPWRGLGCSDRRRILETPLPPDLHQSFDEGRYTKAVTAILQEIQEGNVYQADLTHRMDFPFEGDAWSLYRILRELNPAPFAAFLDLPEVAILSSSPERFLKADLRGELESRPIKGTRPRGSTQAEDAALASALRHSEKDRAENLMIVDLVRNDLGRVCEVGSVDVPELMALERYAGVFQLVSKVTGRLRSDCDVLDAVCAAFPPGSMTGAPKIAAIRLLDRLETVRRGIYSGAIGYFDLRGGADLSVVIRTLLLREGRAYLHAGGGVVADSDPVAEYHETLDKARALFTAVAEMRSGSQSRSR